MLEDKKDGWKALIALAPALIILLVFMFFPIINTILTSFICNWKQSGFKTIETAFGPKTVQISSFERIIAMTAIYHYKPGTMDLGLGEYIRVWNDPQFQRGLGNTFILVFITVPLTVIVGLLISVFLNSIKKLQGFFQTVFFLPYVTNTIALGMVFQVLFTKESGLINVMLKWFGNDGINWIGAGGSWFTALFVVTLYTLWNGLAFKILVFLSGLQSIDKQYYQAAQIDGASKAKILGKITVPLLSPMIAYVTITSFIGAFKAYSSVVSIFASSSSGPIAMGGTGGDLMITIVGYIYYHLDGKLMTAGEISKAAAGSVILLLIILAFTVIQMAISKKKVHY